MGSKCVVFIFGVLWWQALGLTTTKLTCETEIDEDGGRDLDIFDINEAAKLDLLEGDIETEDGEVKNTIIGNKFRWPMPVPYYLEESLEINAKGIILKVFEQFRLKTCVDFTHWRGENNYISVYKGSGCSSAIGNRNVGKQTLSIGQGCDRLGIVEHEFLHALGFWHEQSRADRDDYVTIMRDQIEKKKEGNFRMYNDTLSSALNVPYDYGSVMHYSKTTFSIGSKPTIVTNIPYFQDVIGQRMEFSDSDLLKLNRLYNCTSSSTFLDSCSFEKENICGMIMGPNGNAKWEHVNFARFGPYTDHTFMGECRGKGFFMHYSTLAGNLEDKAYLESRLHYPKRSSQCLQFYLYVNGGRNDTFNVWVREYSKTYPKGKLRFIQKISCVVQNSWELQHVTLNVKTKFRVVFEGVKGTTRSAGGFSIDDINLSETTCPQHIWRIRNITGLLATTKPGTNFFSPPLMSPAGYAFQVGVYLNGLNISTRKMAIYFYLISGPRDNHLQWPCPWQQATMALMDQNPDIRQRMSNQYILTTDPNKFTTDSTGKKQFLWDNPKKVGCLVNDSNGKSFYRNRGDGTPSFLTHNTLKSRNFIKGNDAIFLISVDDVSELRKTQPLPHPAGCGNSCLEKKAAQVFRQKNTPIVVAMLLCVGTSSLVVFAAMIVYVWYSRTRQLESERKALLE